MTIFYIFPPPHGIAALTEMHSSPPSEMDQRRCVVYFPDNRKLDLTVSSKQFGKDLWKAVLSQIYLKEEDYFGLKFKTSSEHYSWIENDRKVLDHDIEMKSTEFPLEFTFSVKCYEDSVTVHKHPSTVELIFLHAQSLLYNGEIYIPPDLSLELTAYSLQAFYGDFVSEDAASSNFKKLSCLPRFVLQELPSIEYCEEQVISWYKNLCGISRGQAILYYMSKVEKLTDYGVHFFRVKDKGKLPLWLGICNKGIYQYTSDDKSVPNLKFLWRNLNNLFFREKKFSVEVCFGHKRALSTGSTSAVAEKSKKSEQQPAKTYSWYGSPSLIKSIWLMAIAQHQFYWRRKQSKNKSQTSKTNASILRNELDNNPRTYIVPPTEKNTMQRKGHKNKNHLSTPTRSKVAALKVETEPKSPQVKALEKEMVSDLKKRKLDLEDQLYDKVQELKAVCQEELNLTKIIPFDYLRYVLPWEEKPVPEKKIGASYPVTLRHNNNKSYRNNSAISNELERLENECNLLNQITKAAYKLAYDPTLRGKTKKKKLQFYQKSLKKLQILENQVDEMRKKQGRDVAFRQSTLIMTSDIDIMAAMRECSIDDKSERSSLSDGILLDDETSCSSGAEALSTHSTPALLRPNSRSADVDVEESPIHRSQTPPPTGTKMAWLDTPKVKLRKNGQADSSNSYPVLPSPNSFRSTTSHSSGTDTPPTHTGHHELRWEQPRNRKPVWKESSLDSLESTGSRKSNEQIYGSPGKRRNRDIPNANARRIARARQASLNEKNKSHEPSNQMNTANPILDIVQNTDKDDCEDSRISLTDSGHGTDSRVPSFHEDDTLRRKKDDHPDLGNISNSSLSELSAKSNPLPSTNLPKFVPSVIANRGRSATHNSPTLVSEIRHEDNRIRKRSSSFTETGSTIVRPTVAKESVRTLITSRSQSSHSAHPTNGSQINGSIPIQDASGKQRHLLTTRHSENELQPTLFDTNFNIRRQYLSHSQGQLIRQNSDGNTIDIGNRNHDTVDAASTGQFVPNMEQTHQAHMFHETQYSKPSFMARNNNSNNNKLNFGQLYKTSLPSQHRHPPSHVYSMQDRAQNSQQASIVNNIPKCNSLDSVLESRRPQVSNYTHEQQRYYQQHTARSTPTPPTQYPQYHSPYNNSPRDSGTPDPDVSKPAEMTDHDRDRYNNEAFSEISGMEWAPSLDDYGSRASVAESLPAKSKREDIRNMLKERMINWPRRTPSVPNSYAMKTRKQSQQVQAKIRTEIMRLQEQENQKENSRHHGRDEPTWEEYKNNMTVKRQQNQNASKAANQSDHTGVNIFAHNPPPPQRHHYGKQPERTDTAKQGAIHKSYISRNGYPMQMNTAANSDHRRQTASTHNLLAQENTSPRQYQQQDMYYQAAMQPSQQSHWDNNGKDIEVKNSEKEGATVIQATRTSPDGHTVSVFGLSSPVKKAPTNGDVFEESLVKPSTLDRKKAKQKLRSMSKDQLSPTSDSSELSDFLQGKAVEAARAAQKLLSASQGSIDQLSVLNNPPPLPLAPPNSGLRSSIRKKADEKILSNTLDRRTGRSGTDASSFETSTPRRNNLLETGRPRSRSKTRRDNRDRGRSSSPTVAVKSNGAVMPVRDMRSSSKTQLDSNTESIHAAPKFQRTLSTPIRAKHAPSHAQGRSSPKNNKITGMYDEPMMRATLRPPAAPRSRVSTPTPTRSTKISSNSSSNWQSVENTNFQLGQSGTLPRAPKSHKRLERSGSTSGSVYQENRVARLNQSKADAKLRSGQSSTPRNEKYTFLANEDLQYKRKSIPETHPKPQSNPTSEMVVGSKPPLPVYQTAMRCKTASVNLKKRKSNHRRSLSETWKQPGGIGQQTPSPHAIHHQQPSTVIPMQDQYYGHHHHHPQHHHMYQMHMSQHSNLDPRLPQEQPRRTASADDLLWSSPDSKLRAQQGTLV